ncbi:MAG TPA: hypothetical protein VKA75_11295 [Reyranella sp.]|nr:hypothetical protein [Reyranella sp.]
MAIEPLDETRGEGVGVSLLMHHAAAELSDAGAFVERGLPVLGRPVGVGRTQPCQNAGLVMRQQVDHRRWRRGGGLKREGVAAIPAGSVTASTTRAVHPLIWRGLFHSRPSSA